MGERIGILYPEEQKAFGVEIDALIDFNKFKRDNRWVNMALNIAERKDDDIFSALIKFLDDTYAEKIPANLKPAAREVALAFLNKDVSAFNAATPALINQLVDIKRLSEETEGIIIAGLVQGVVEAMGFSITS